MFVGFRAVFSLRSLRCTLRAPVFRWPKHRIYSLQLFDSSLRSRRSAAGLFKSSRTCLNWLQASRKSERKFRLPAHPRLPLAAAFTSLSAFFFLVDHNASTRPAEPQTKELCLLRESEKEYEQMKPARPTSFSHFPEGLLMQASYCINCYLLEPMATGLRFLHLAIIFLPVILAMPAIWLGPRIRTQDNERAGTVWWYSFLVKSMEKAGPTFIKLGQWAASRTDIFPLQMCSIMSTLHSNVAAHPLCVTKKTIEEAFGGRAFSSIFLEFDESPLGVGAIAQVYRAKLSEGLLPSQSMQPANPDNPTRFSLKGSAQELLNKVDAFAKSALPQIPNDWVAIKVLHPHVEKLVHRDLRIMKSFATLINTIPTLEWLSLPDEVEKFGEMMRLQLDLRIEASNLARFRENFKYRTGVTFPAPYTDYSTRQVLVEEFANGIPLEVFLQFGGGVYQKNIADIGLDAFLRMLLIDNFAHADLHPGNILVRFYRPVPAPLKIRLPFLTQISVLGNSDADDDTEWKTDQATSRLRLLKRDPEKWQEELSKLTSEGFKPQLIFIDTGLVTELSPINRQNFLDLFTAVAEFDGYRAGELMVDRCRQPGSVIDRDVFCLRMQHLVLGVKNKTFTLGKIKIADVLSEVMSMIRSHHVRLEGDFINVVVSILLLEGIGRRLDPNIDIFKSSLPILRQLGAQKGHEMLSKDVNILKIWLGLELRTILSSSLEGVDNSFLVEYWWSE